MNSFNQEVFNKNHIFIKFSKNFLLKKNKIFDSKIKELEDKYSDEKSSCLKNFLKGKQLTSLNSKREEFLSYDTWKKQSKGNTLLSVANKSINENVYPSPSHRRLSKENSSLYFSPIKGPDDKYFVESVLKYLLVKKQNVFPENRVKYLQNELFGLENQEKSNNGRMQYLALNVINNGEELLKEIFENKQNTNLARIQVRKYFLQKLFFMGMLEKGNCYKVEENLWDVFIFMANEMLMSTHFILKYSRSKQNYKVFMKLETKMRRNSII